MELSPLPLNLHLHSLAEVAAITRVSPRTVQRFVNTGRMPAPVKIRRFWDWTQCPGVRHEGDGGRPQRTVAGERGVRL